MHTIAISEQLFQSLTEWATMRGETVEQVVAELVAQERWEEHAVAAYDAYHASQAPWQPPQEALTEDEFLQSLQAGAHGAAGHAE